MNNSGRRSAGREDNVYSVVCPYLGMPDDPHTYIAWGQPKHICYRANPPQPIDIRYQQFHCLTLKHSACRIYHEGCTGPLPEGIRGDIEVTPISNPVDWRREIGPVEEDEKELPPAIPADLSEVMKEVETLSTGGEPEQVDNSPVERKIPSRKKSAARRFDRRLLLVIPLFLVMLVCLVISGIAGYNRINDMRTAGQTGTAFYEALALAATQTVGIPTVTATIDQAFLAAQTVTAEAETARLTELAKPEETPTEALPTPTPTPTLLTPTATPTAPVYTCDQIEAYTLEIVAGPVLVPPVGYVYVGGTTPPPIYATWWVANTSPCDWMVINLFSMSSRRLLKPTVLPDENATEVPEELEVELVLAKPGDVVAIRLPFSPGAAYTVHNEWILEINSWRLVDQPHLALDVDRWILYLAPTATPRPSGGGGGDTGVTEPTATPVPDTRATEPLPTTRP